jgi:hypothetical protein
MGIPQYGSILFNHENFIDRKSKKNFFQNVIIMIKL